MTMTELPKIQLVSQGDELLDAFEVVTAAEHNVRVKTPWLFEIGEELTLRITRGGAIANVKARVARHATVEGELVTALDLLEVRPLRTVITG